MANEATDDADDSTADDTEYDFGFIEDTDTRDSRELVEMYDRLNDLKEEVYGDNVITPIYDVEVTSDVMPEEACEALQTRILNTIGQFRGIISNEKYIPGGVYWDLVREYTDEVIETLEDDPDWAESDLTIFREIVMPHQMADTYPGDPVADFCVLRNSKHQPDGWTTEYHERYIDNQGIIEKIEDDGWTGVLSTMAYAACVKDVAQKVRAEGYDLDLDHFEYET